MNPYISWAIVLLIAGGLGYYYTDGLKSKSRIPLKTRPDRVESGSSVTKQKRRSRRTPEPSSTSVRKVESPSNQPAPVTSDEQVDEDIDNKEFAKRFAATKQGVLPSDSTKSRKSEKRIKTIPASQAESPSNELSVSHLSTGTSSTTGADADDDLSSAGSPIVKATTPSADDISDMLEPAAPGPSILRLTGSMEKPAAKLQTQSSKPVETKKQRQQRQKNEARKEQMLEAEEYRRKLLEKQLHTAREAERQEAAKRQPTGPATNVWKAENHSHSDKTSSLAPLPVTDPLLDTFEPEPASKSGEPTNTTWANNLPSEEEQMRILGVSTTDDDWTTVSTKKSKKKVPKSEDSVSDASIAEVVNGEQTRPVVTPIPLPQSGEKGHPLDSDWVA